VLDCMNRVACMFCAVVVLLCVRVAVVEGQKEEAGAQSCAG